MKFLLVLTAVVFAENAGQFLKAAVKSLVPENSQREVTKMVNAALEKSPMSEVESMKLLLKILGENGIHINTIPLIKEEKLAVVVKEAIQGNEELFFKTLDSNLIPKAVEAVEVTMEEFIVYLDTKMQSDNQVVVSFAFEMIISLAYANTYWPFGDLCLQRLSNKPAIDKLMVMVQSKRVDAAKVLARLYNQMGKDPKIEFGYSKEDMVKVYANYFEFDHYFGRNDVMNYFDLIFNSPNRSSTIELFLEELMKDDYDTPIKNSLLKIVFGAYSFSHKAIKSLVSVAFASVKKVEFQAVSILLLIRIRESLDGEEKEILNNLIVENSSAIESLLIESGNALRVNKKFSRIYFEVLEHLLQEKSTPNPLLTTVKSELLNMHRLFDRPMMFIPHLGLFLESDVEQSRKSAVLQVFVKDQKFYSELINSVVSTTVEVGPMKYYLQASSRILVDLYRINEPYRSLLKLQPKQLVDLIFKSRKRENLFYFAAEFAKYSREDSMKELYEILLNRLIERSVKSLGFGRFKFFRDVESLFKESVRLMNDESNDIGFKQLALDLARKVGTNDIGPQMVEEEEFSKQFGESLGILGLDAKKLLNSSDQMIIVTY